MKRSELDLAKVHVDQWGSVARKDRADRTVGAADKSWNGAKLALTRAGWATVTKDGTVVEVLDAFKGKKTTVIASFEERDEVNADDVINDTDLLNPAMIGSPGTSDVDTNVEVADSVVNDPVALVGDFTSLNPFAIYVSGDGTGAIAATIDITNAALEDPVVTKADIDFSVLLTVADGYPPYSYTWTLQYNAAPAVTLSDTINAIILSAAELDSLTGATSVATDKFTLVGTVTDSKVTPAETDSVTITLTVA